MRSILKKQIGKTMIKKENNLMMLLLIGSETIFFISLIMGYVFFWRGGHFQSAVKSMLDIKVTAVFSLLLFTSSFTFWMAERNYNKGNEKKLKLWLIATIVLGTVFMIGQGHEYYSLLHKNLTLSSSEFGTSFYTLTGFHGLHVIIGIIMLIILLVLALHGFFKRKSTVLSTIGIYWHFVDAVWLVVFTVIYVVPYL
jgi:heme/copper-type cytochrome/quinol oxidase subunit 3